MSKPLVSDELRAVIESLLPDVPQSRGRLATGTGPGGLDWHHLCAQVGDSIEDPAVWQRLRDWQEVGVWERFHWVLLD